ncbi:MAG: replication-relaxation family protein [Solirubrobacteraceae bacterium]
MSPRVAHDRPLPPIAPAILASLYQHRLLSTTQLHALHTPDDGLGWTRRVLRLLSDRELVERVQTPGTLSHWFLTDAGADAVETAGPRAEPRRRVPTRAQAEGPLRAHTLAVNDVGVAFVKAAREHGDECSPDSWRHEIAHTISQWRGRRPTELVIADALLSYLQVDKDGAITLHQRFIELDRGTARPAEQLASKITRYTKLRYYTPPRTDDRAQEPEPLWRSSYRSFPHLLIVLADQPPQRIRQRIQRTLALHHSDPAKKHLGEIPLSFVLLADLAQQGPFAPIFITAEEPEQPRDWLGQPPAQEK